MIRYATGEIALCNFQLARTEGFTLPKEILRLVLATIANNIQKCKGYYIVLKPPAKDVLNTIRIECLIEEISQYKW